VGLKLAEKGEDALRGRPLLVGLVGIYKGIDNWKSADFVGWQLPTTPDREQL